MVRELERRNKIQKKDEKKGEYEKETEKKNPITDSKEKQLEVMVAQKDKEISELKEKLEKLKGIAKVSD